MAGSPQASAAAPPTATSNATPGRGQFGGRGGATGPGATWWKDDSVKKEIGLGPDQVHRIDGIYEKRARDMASFVDELHKQRDLLEQMARERTADDATITVQISKFEAPQAELDKSRILMDYKISRVLTDDQNKKLQAYWERQRAADWAARCAADGRGRGRGPFPRLP